MKLKRVIQLPTKNKETLTLEMDVDEDNFVYSVDFMEKRVQEVYGYYEGKIKVPKSSPKKEEKPKTRRVTPRPPSGEGTAFDSISLDSEDFNLFNVAITRIGEIQTGTAKTGNDWQMHSITVKDVKDKTRDLIAWGDHIELFDSLKVGDMLDIERVSKIKDYKGKHQYTLGKDTEIKGAE